MQCSRAGLSTLTRQLTIPPNWTSEELYTLSETSEEYKKVRAGFKETAQRDIKKARLSFIYLRALYLIIKLNVLHNIS